MPYLPEIDARLAVLGFDRRGRYWQLQGSNVLLEAPGSALSPGERRRMPHSEADDSFQLSVRKTCSSTACTSSSQRATPMPSVRPSTCSRSARSIANALIGAPPPRGSRAPSSCSISWLVAFVQERRSSPGSFTKSPGIYSEGVRSYEQWQRERAENAAWVAAVDRALGPYRRERPRDPEEAALLRELGTPEELIGPIREEPRPGTYRVPAVVATRDLIRFA